MLVYVVSFSIIAPGVLTEIKCKLVLIFFLKCTDKEQYRVGLGKAKIAQLFSSQIIDKKAAFCMDLGGFEPPTLPTIQKG